MSHERRYQESSSCKQKQQTRLYVKGRSPLCPHDSVWCPRHDGTYHGSHLQQTPLIEATSSPRHQSSDAKAESVIPGDMLFSYRTPGLGNRLFRSIDDGASRILPGRFSNVACGLVARLRIWRSLSESWGSRRRVIGSGGACIVGHAKDQGCEATWGAHGLSG